MPAAGHHYTALCRAVGRYSRPQDKQPVSRKGASHRTKSLVTLRNGINVIDTGALAWIGVGGGGGGEGGTTGVLITTLVRRQKDVDWMRQWDPHEKFLRIEEWRKNWVTCLSFPIYSFVHINDSIKERALRRSVDSVYNCTLILKLILLLLFYLNLISSNWSKNCSYFKLFLLLYSLILMLFLLFLLFILLAIILNFFQLVQNCSYFKINITSFILLRLNFFQLVQKLFLF